MKFRFRKDLALATEVTAPMEGKILRIIRQEGERVEEDGLLLVLDAMKMEIEVVAPVTGTINEIHVSEGQNVDSDTTLITID